MIGHSPVHFAGLVPAAILTIRTGVLLLTLLNEQTNKKKPLIF